MSTWWIKTIYLEFPSSNFYLVSCYNNLYSRHFNCRSCTDENVFSLFRIVLMVITTKFRPTIRIYKMPSRNFVLSSRNFNFRSSISRCNLVISYCYHEISTYNHVYSRWFLIILYCHHEISTFDLVFTRCLLVISCCYHEISTFKHVNSRCFLVKTWLNYFYTWSYYASVTGWLYHVCRYKLLLRPSMSKIKRWICIEWWGKTLSNILSLLTDFESSPKLS